ncbi:hypothetical protein B0H10DRAFT_2084514 [Mycena sp. CBHHK59/15]|nr:hypothetical protein B0H10DRAFT_2104973 [Mycena sp. CBHHK59/15]KAJ6579329.1 hypothetical protein B0H10DRAFT_2100462 [Mycena sp. CBHHK59/15]KAJ6599507.1 hypothetical protein B0H10DRAFT_2084514 [Mycena sp. CBHHK59/15]
MQERVESDNTENFIIHESLDRFIVNSHAFHNAHLLRAALPRDLLAPIPLFEDRRAKHDEFASTLRDTQAVKRAKKKTAEPEPEDDDEDNAGAAGTSQPRSRKRARTTAPAEPREELDGEGPVVDNLVAGRAKRVVKRSTKAKLAAEDVSEGSEDEEGLDDASEEDEYLASDDDYSD